MENKVYASVCFAAVMANKDIQGGPKKVSHKVLSISLSNINRFSKFFHWRTLWKIC